MDLVVTVPKQQWVPWIAEGDLPGEQATGEWDFSTGGARPRIEPGERIYVVSHGLVRGYAPLVRIEEPWSGERVLVRAGGAVAETPLVDGAPLRVDGFRGWRYRWWERTTEGPFAPFDAWMTEGIGDVDQQRIRWILEAFALRRKLLPWLEAHEGPESVLVKIGRRPARVPRCKPLSAIALGKRRMAELLRYHGHHDAPPDYIYFSDGLVCIPSARDPGFLSMIHGAP